ncbi:gas vesicle protein [Streptomyces phaeochromogenes]|uniref:gas vesicle protein n=1 Tax=Streptomyces phaeochromogenes TaxID=1923 RepID=UPI00371FB5F0
MTDALVRRTGAPSPQPGGAGNLADILERVLDKGVVIAGDIKINLLDIELLTIKLRLLIVSVDTAREMGIDWWEHDPTLSSRAVRPAPSPDLARTEELAAENARLLAELQSLNARLKEPDAL